ncbi:hypothetical protein MRX96_038971 [Rhipicephalus microplus]
MSTKQLLYVLATKTVPLAGFPAIQAMGVGSDVVKRKLDKLEAEGVIRRVDIPTGWCAVLVVPKVSGGYWLCILVLQAMCVTHRERPGLVGPGLGNKSPGQAWTGRPLYIIGPGWPASGKRRARAGP